MKLKVLVAAVCCTFLLGNIAFANKERREQRRELRKEMRGKRQALRKERRAKRKEIRENTAPGAAMPADTQDQAH